MTWPFSGNTDPNTADASPEAGVPPSTDSPTPSSPEGTPVAGSPDQQTVTVDQFNQLTGTVNELAGYFKQAMQPAAAPVAPEPVPVAPTRSVTADQINAAYEAGDYGKGAQLMAKYNSEEVDAKLFDFKQNEFNPIVKSATSTMAAMSQQTTSQFPHYATYKNEVDAAVAQMGTNAAANPENWRLAYDWVVGRHVDDIVAGAATQRETDARKTQAAHAGAGVSPEGGQPGKEGGPITVKDAYGTDGYNDLRALALRRSLTPEALVQEQYAKSAYKGTYQEYLKMRKASTEEQYA